MAASAALLALLPLLAKAPGLLKKMYQSKHFMSALLGAGFLGSTALSEAGKAGERDLSREELKLQERLAKAQAEAAKLQVEESKRNTEKYLEELRKEKVSERRRGRETDLMQTFMNSQDRQMALILQAVQGMSNQPPGAPVPSSSGGGMLGLMRSSY